MQPAVKILPCISIFGILQENSPVEERLAVIGVGFEAIIYNVAECFSLVEIEPLLKSFSVFGHMEIVKMKYFLLSSVVELI